MTTMFEAWAEADSYYDIIYPYNLDEGHNDPRDAFRHAYTAGVMSMEYGEDTAILLGWAWEKKGDYKGQPAVEHNMDMWNNNFGAGEGTVATSKADLAYRISNALDNDLLIVDPQNTGGKQYEDYPQKPTPQEAEDLPFDPEDFPLEPEEGSPQDPQSCPVPEDWFDPTGEGMGDAPGIWSPLVIDMDNDGIELTNLNTNPVYWDIDSDGFGEACAWVEADDALLAIDLNLDGVINNHGELFGTNIVDGFTVLSVYDSNIDNVINSSDTDFNKILVWQDLNQDGISQSNELKTLTQAGISSISLNDSSVNYQIEGNPVTHQSTVTMADTSTRTVVDAWFNYDNSNSEWLDTTNIDIRTLFEPNLRGFGDVKDLYIQMSLDEDLFDNVNEISSADLETLFDPAFDLVTKFKTILYQWAGVDDLTAPYFQTLDFTKKVEFLDTLTGKNIYTDGETAGYAQVDFINHVVWPLPFNHLFADFMAQTAMDTVFDGNVTYNSSLGATEGYAGLSEDGLDAIATEIDNSDDPLFGWALVVRMIEGVVGVNNLSSGDYALLQSAISGTSCPLSLNELYHAVTNNIADVIDESLVGTEIAIGTSGNDSNIYGSSEDNLLIGREGNDNLAGAGGNDVYLGGTGNNIFLDYGGGDDTYVYQGGNDEVTDNTGSNYYGDRIVFEKSVLLSDLTMERLHYTNPLSLDIWGGADLVLHVDGQGSIKINDQYNAYGNQQGIEIVQFADGSTLSLKTLDALVMGTSGNDTLTGADRAYYLNDRINAGFGNDTINGGLGHNYLAGDWGDDTYMYGGGLDTIYEAYGTDSIVFNNTFDPNLFTVTFNPLQNPYDVNTQNLNILYDGELKIIIKGALGNGEGQFVENLVIDGVQTIDLSSLDYTQHGTSGGETLYGFDAYALDDNTIYGHGGNDTIFGRSGDDIIDGGDGDDYVYGDDGVDMVLGGDGADYLDGGWGNDTLVGGAGNDVMWSGGDNDILKGGDGADTLNGGNGADTFVFEADSAFNAIDTVMDFYTNQNDKLDTADLLIGYTPGTSDIDDFVSLTTGGGNTMLSVDRDGTGSTYGSQQIATLTGVTGLVVDDLLNNGHLIAV